MTRKRTFEEIELGLEPEKYGKMTGKKLPGLNPWDIKTIEQKRASEEGADIDKKIIEMLRGMEGRMSDKDMRKMQWIPKEIDTFDEEPETINIPIKGR